MTSREHSGVIKSWIWEMSDNSTDFFSGKEIFMEYSKSAKCIGAMFLVFCGISVAAPSLTIYNQNFAVVRENLNLNLNKGINEVTFTDITAHLEPDSVVLRDPEGKRALQILEQNYRADPISQGLLLSLYEGKEIEFLTTDKDKEAKARSFAAVTYLLKQACGNTAVGMLDVRCIITKPKALERASPSLRSAGSSALSCPVSPFSPPLPMILS